MNEFERRWKLAVGAARTGTSDPPDEAPFGFATRVIAQWPAKPELSLVTLWQRLAVRVLAVMTLILLGLAAYGALSTGGDPPFEPSVENAVADSFWLL